MAHPKLKDSHFDVLHFDVLHVNGALPHCPDPPFHLLNVDRWLTPFLYTSTFNVFQYKENRGVTIDKFGGHSIFLINVFAQLFELNSLLSRLTYKCEVHFLLSLKLIFALNDH